MILAPKLLEVQLISVAIWVMRIAWPSWKVMQKCCGLMQIFMHVRFLRYVQIPWVHSNFILLSQLISAAFEHCILYEWTSQKVVWYYYQPTKCEHATCTDKLTFALACITSALLSVRPILTRLLESCNHVRSPMFCWGDWRMRMQFVPGCFSLSKDWVWGYSQARPSHSKTISTM